MKIKVRFIYYSKKTNDDAEHEFFWSIIPRIGESVMIEEYAYKITDVIWDNVDVGGDGPMVTIYTNN